MSQVSIAEEIQKYKDLLDAGTITQEEFDKKKAELLSAQTTASSNGSGMSAKTTAIIAYITWIGWIVALCAGDKEGAKFHINQALVINLFSLLSIIPLIGFIWGIFMLVCWILGLIHACNFEEKEVPLIGKIRIIQ